MAACATRTPWRLSGRGSSCSASVATLAHLGHAWASAAVGSTRPAFAASCCGLARSWSTGHTS
eukprot:4115941-Lingulodinium_polyedra.AAC.1